MTRPGRATLLALTIAVGPSAAAQTTTTHCNGYGNTLNCTSNTTPSLQQQYDQNMHQFQQSMAQLGAAIAQRRAAKAQQQAVWAAAATEEARQAAEVARSNYDATTVAMSRFAADTGLATTPPVNQDLAIDWSLVDGVETRLEVQGEHGMRWDVLRKWALTDTPGGNKLLRMDETAATTSKNQHIGDLITAIRFDPATGLMLLTRDGRPGFTTVKPVYETTVRAGTHAFATKMNGRGFDVSVPPGTIDGNMLMLAIAALPGELPPSVRIWIVNGQGEVVPADVELVGRTTVKEPVGPNGGTCAGASGKKEKRDGLTLRVSAGTEVETITVLTAAPHLAVYPELKCRLINR